MADVNTDWNNALVAPFDTQDIIIKSYSIFGLTEKIVQSYAWLGFNNK